MILLSNDTLRLWITTWLRLHPLNEILDSDFETQLYHGVDDTNYISLENNIVAIIHIGLFLWTYVYIVTCVWISSQTILSNTNYTDICTGVIKLKREKKIIWKILHCETVIKWNLGGDAKMFIEMLWSFHVVHKSD